MIRIVPGDLVVMYQVIEGGFKSYKINNEPQLKGWTEDLRQLIIEWLLGNGQEPNWTWFRRRMRSYCIADDAVKRYIYSALEANDYVGSDGKCTLEQVPGIMKSRKCTH